jgi:hypothetical protein
MIAENKALHIMNYELTPLPIIFKDCLIAATKFATKGLF